MNIFNFLSLYMPFLDVAIGPSFSMGEVDPATKVIVIVILIAFLGFIGYLIWNSLKKDK